MGPRGQELLYIHRHLWRGAWNEWALLHRFAWQDRVQCFLKTTGVLHGLFWRSVDPQCSCSQVTFWPSSWNTSIRSRCWWHNCRCAHRHLGHARHLGQVSSNLSSAERTSSEANTRGLPHPIHSKDRTLNGARPHPLPHSRSYCNPIGTKDFFSLSPYPPFWGASWTLPELWLFFSTFTPKIPLTPLHIFPFCLPEETLLYWCRSWK